MSAGDQSAFLLSCVWLATVLWLMVRAIDQRGLFRSLPPLQTLQAGQAPYVTIIVPARDESANIGPCLRCLLSQCYPPSRFEVLVIDDDSADDTARVVASVARRDTRVKLLRSPMLPPGWIGKSHACWAGVGVASPKTQWLCFLDADVRAEPALLASAVRASLHERIDFLSLAPRHELRTFAERLILPCGLFLLAFCQDLRARQAPDSTDATATGQFMLIRRHAYQAAGGHAAVPAAISEDVALARLIKRCGYKVVLRSGDRLLSTRMYTGWRTLWPGLAKNLVDMLGGTRSALVTVFVTVPLAWAALIVPALGVIGYTWNQNATSSIALGAALLGSAAAFGLHVAGAIHFRIPFWYGLLFPLGYTAGALMTLDSMRRRLRGRVTWKGRTYS